MRSESIDVRTLASPLSYPRVAVVVPRFGRTIVERNSLRRRLRELVRINLLSALTPQDVLLRATAGAYRRSFEQLRQEVRQLVARLAAD